MAGARDGALGVQGAAAHPLRRERHPHQRDVAGLRGVAESSGVRHEMHKYPGTPHGFHNNSPPRFDESAAKVAWERTIAHSRSTLREAWLVGRSRVSSGHPEGRRPHRVVGQPNVGFLCSADIAAMGSFATILCC